MLAKIEPGEVRKLVKVIEPQLGFDSLGIVDGNDEIDNGLGFGQGSTSGVLGLNYAKMKKISERCGGCSDFSRQGVPEIDCKLRQTFNLHRLCDSPYATHFDPGPNACRTDWRNKQQRCAVVPYAVKSEGHHANAIQTDSNKVVTIVMVVTMVIAMYIFIKRR